MEAKRVHRKLTVAERARHRQIRDDVARQGPRLAHRSRGKRLELDALRHAMQLLKHEREARGLSLADIAERSGIDKSNLSKLENEANANPTLETLVRIAHAIGVELTIGVKPAA